MILGLFSFFSFQFSLFEQLILHGLVSVCDDFFFVCQNLSPSDTFLLLSLIYKLRAVDSDIRLATSIVLSEGIAIGFFSSDFPSFRSLRCRIQIWRIVSYFKVSGAHGDCVVIWTIFRFQNPFFSCHTQISKNKKIYGIKMALLKITYYNFPLRLFIPISWFLSSSIFLEIWHIRLARLISCYLYFTLREAWSMALMPPSFKTSGLGKSSL